MDLSAPPGQEQPTQQQLPSLPGKHFSKQLAAAVRSINCTYAIFWSISTSRPGVLTWKDGFYNGEVKTRKFTNSTDLTDGDLVLRRSEQLKELYESLQSGECDQRARRPAASLSPEELGDAEWYYTTCMTYAFGQVEGLPGKSLASNEHVWLCNAQFAQTKTFQRALLAKTASIQTVACIPFIAGVLELGTTDQVLEDADMVNRISTSFWELKVPACSNMDEPSGSPSQNGDADIAFEDPNQSAAEGLISREIECLPDGNLECILKELDEFYGLYGELDVGAMEDNSLMDGSFQAMCSQEAAPHAPDANGVTDDLLILSSSTEPSPSSSCFTTWKRSSGSSEDTAMLFVGESQKLLKKVVSHISCMDDGGGGTARIQESDVKGHVMSERRRREKLNKMFLILKSSVPSIQKVDKISILAETIAYLKELKQRIRELESSRTTTQRFTRTLGQRRCDVNGKNIPARSKRKASELS